ncbi:MAG: PfkB family carbohydrate kinase [Verrucomicrobia bacterium]|nr:PfkB family carbohydrate kinase [Verrucomicrobiota bacterium]MDA1068504.1 PfkB family carbohydrate kinase [Verrucomicrobiota bacterium]
MKRVDVLCIGLACWDLNFQVDRTPGSNEKVVATDLISEGGGPAANAAYCISRLGGEAAFLGRLGQDSFGDAHLKELEDVGVNTEGIIRGSAPTPIACVLVNGWGERSIVNFSEPQIPLEFDFNYSLPSCLLLDGHEWAASQKALEHFVDIPSVLDAGSMRESTVSLAKQITYLIASRAFATDFAQSEDPKDWLSSLRDQAPFVAITEGSLGVHWKDSSNECGTLAAKEVSVIDTTGAGDIFHGAFALAISKGMGFTKALAWANEVAAISTTKKGGRASSPFCANVPRLEQNAQ